MAVCAVRGCEHEATEVFTYDEATVMVLNGRCVQSMTLLCVSSGSPRKGVSF